MKALGIIGILITLAIICFMVWTNLSGSNNSVNQVEQGQADIQKAKDAAQQQNDYNQNLQNEINSRDSSGDVNYNSVRAKANALK